MPGYSGTSGAGWEEPLSDIDAENAHDPISDLQRKCRPVAVTRDQRVDSRRIALMGHDHLAPVAEASDDPDSFDPEQRRQLLRDHLMDTLSRG